MVDHEQLEKEIAWFREIAARHVKIIGLARRSRRSVEKARSTLLEIIEDYNSEVIWTGEKPVDPTPFKPRGTHASR